ncbi:hypothetical protein SFRURICE_006367 [Spodoptera frugiperda]|nr:hypothetical protein SFRURICE_006367 [Spodoptera frugiperda]
MMTRRATTVRDLEEKLRLTLKGWMGSNILCKRNERDSGKWRVKSIGEIKNASLKNELAELHVQYMDVLDQHSQLQYTISTFQDCNNTHEAALQRITELESELCDAHRIISCSQLTQVHTQHIDTNTLYDELIGSGLQCREPVTIDLTGEDTVHISPFRSHNKLKKYIKINKLIKRTQNSLKKQKLKKVILSLRKDRSNLIKDLQSCNSDLDHCRRTYDTDIQSLHKDLYNKEVNQERYESLANDLQCSCVNQPQPPETSITPGPTVIKSIKSQLNSKHNYKTYVYSDELGSGLGQMRYDHLDHSYINNSYHNMSYNKIIKQITHTDLDEKSVLVLMVGNSLGLTRGDVVNGVDTLLKSNSGKIIVCAFPYSNTLSSSKNKYIGVLNNILHKMTCQNDRLLFFDTNKFISNLIFNKKGIPFKKM